MHNKNSFEFCGSQAMVQVPLVALEAHPGGTPQDFGNHC